MITFKTSSAKFTYRAAGVILHQDHLLCEYAMQDDFYFLPGGRCELGESSLTTIIREMQEELGLTVKVERLLWIIENFFEERGRLVHELGHYYLLQLPQDASILDVSRSYPGCEEERRAEYRWLPLATLSEARLFPSFLRTNILNLPDQITHIVHHGQD